MKAALYHRVSTVDQSAAAAGRELRAAAKRLGARVVLTEEETGSGAANDRPGLLRILRAAKRGELDVVIVWKLDRWGRSALDLLHNLRELETAGVRFIAITQGLDVRPGGDAMSRLLLQVLAAVAEFERDLVRERTRLGMQRAKERGAPVGRPRVARPSAAAVLELRRAEVPWTRVAELLGCTVHAARSAAR